MEAFATADLDATAADVQAALDERGVGFGAGSDHSRFVVDPLPRVIEADEWEVLRRGLAQRGRALAAFVADVYGQRSVCADGVVPERVVESAERFEPDLLDRPPTRFGWVVGFDLVGDGDEPLRVLEDNMRTPSGFAYALAAELDLPVVRPDELLCRDGRLYARRDGAAPRPIDVIYRRTDEDRLRDAVGEPTWLAEKLLEPLLAGTLAVVNPFGAGVADDKLAHAYVEDMVRFYCGEEPLIESVRSYDLGDPQVLDSVFGRLDELVVKPRDGYGAEGVVVCPRVSPRAREEVRRAVAAAPDCYIAQELVDLSTEPTVCDGRLEPRHVDLRPFAIGVGEAAVTAPLALTRVALPRGSLIVNSSREGGGKDTWLLA